MRAEKTGSQNAAPGGVQCQWGVRWQRAVEQETGSPGLQGDSQPHTQSLGLKYTEKGGLFKKGLYQAGKHGKAWWTKTAFKTHSALQWISW